MFKFDKKIEEFFSYCKENKIDVYLVGGAVRDYLLNVDCYDFDCCLTSEYTAAVEALQRKYECVIDEKYQSIKFSIDDYSLEISHARKEEDYLDYRHPGNIKFINDIKIDSKRRDVTINALYYKDGILYDFYNGKEDIADRKIRVIGDTLVRFKEDPLRILRMIRFACLGFTVCNRDKKIIFDNKELLKNLSVSSFNKEVDRILEINNIDVLEEYKVVFESYFNTYFGDLNMLNRLSSLEYKKTYLNISNKSNVYRYKDIFLDDDYIVIAKAIYGYGEAIIKDFVSYYDCIHDTTLIDTYNKVINNGFYSKKQLEISSQEIITIIEKRELTSVYIDLMSYNIIEGKLLNKKDELIKFILERENETSL